MSYMFTATVSDNQKTKVDQNLEQDGWSPVLYPGKDSYPPFAHTIGLMASFMHPEVFVLGLPHDKALQALKAAARFVQQGGRLASDTEDADGNPLDLPFAVRELSAEVASRLGYLAREMYGYGEFDGLQLFLPDNQGLFPWDDGCDPELAWGQTVLLDVVRNLEDTPRPN